MSQLPNVTIAKCLNSLSVNGPKKIAMNSLYRVVLGSRLMQIKHFLLPYDGPHYTATNFTWLK